MSVGALVALVAVSVMIGCGSPSVTMSEGSRGENGTEQLDGTEAANASESVTGTASRLPADEAAAGLSSEIATVPKASSADAADRARDSKEPVHSPPSRRFLFDYGGTVKQLPPDSNVRIWLPMPPSSDEQEIRTVQIDLPGEHSISEETKYGNQILYCEVKAPASREVRFNVTYEVNRKEVRGLTGSPAPPLDNAQRTLFLAANAKVPIDGKPRGLLTDINLPTDDGIALGKLLYDRVGDHMKYDKSRPGYGTGDAVWACDSRFGNCTDFHSLFISLSRSQQLPARFEIGFPLPPNEVNGTVGGYHCWAYFFVGGKGWVPVDISEADKHPEMKDYYFGNLTANRVTFTVGRDLTLVPKQAGPALNFFVYPYVEVEAQAWPTTKMDKQFTFENI